MATAAERIVSVDVECVANGCGHNDRCVARVAVVGTPPAGHPQAGTAAHAELLLDALVAPPDGTSVVSYLTPITGLRAADFDGAALQTLDAVVAAVRALLGPDVVLVGQGIASDIQWLQLQAGCDYARSVDLAEVFRTYNPRYSSYNYWTLRHEATTLLSVGRLAHEEHCPADDARSSILLYRKYVVDAPHELEAAKARLLSVRPAPSVAKQLNYQYEGVCMAKFMAARCICGQPTGK